MKDRIRQWKAYLRTHKRTVFLLVAVKLLLKIGLAGYLLLATTECRGQSVNQLIRSGNKLYHKEKFNNATESYTRALQLDPKNTAALFNHSDALYQLKEFDKAGEQFRLLSESNTRPDIKAKAYHNLGNVYYKQEKYAESVRAYKESLKLNPADKETKYNLMMALAKLKQNQGGGGQDQQQQKQDQQQQKQDQQQQQQKQQQGQQPMREDQAQRLLEALGNEENRVQQKLDQKKGEPQTGKTQKDW